MPPAKTNMPLTLFAWGVGLIVAVCGMAWWCAQPVWLVIAGVGVVGAIAWRMSAQADTSKIAALQKDIQSLQRLQANKNELLAMVSHELRTPMNVVLGLHPRIHEGLEQRPQALALLQQMQLATEGLLQVFNGILDASQQKTQTHTTLGHVDEHCDARRAIKEHAWRFLVVDDNSVNVLVVRLMLQKIFPQASIETANSAKAAMQHLSHAQPDLLLIDIWMPDMDGYELARWVREHSSTTLAQTPIVALTGNTHPEDAVQRVASGINEVIYKPLDEKQMCERLCQLLESLAHWNRL